MTEKFKKQVDDSVVRFDDPALPEGWSLFDNGIDGYKDEDGNYQYELPGAFTAQLAANEPDQKTVTFEEEKRSFVADDVYVKPPKTGFDRAAGNVVDKAVVPELSKKAVANLNPFDDYYVVPSDLVKNDDVYVTPPTVADDYVMPPNTPESTIADDYKSNSGGMDRTDVDVSQFDMGFDASQFEVPTTNRLQQ